MINRKWFHYILTFLLIVGCASTMTQLEHYEPIMMDLHTGNFENAVKKIDNAKKSGKYSKKDRVLYYLDKGAVLYFNGEYEKVIMLSRKLNWPWKSCLQKAYQKLPVLFF